MPAVTEQLKNKAKLVLLLTSLVLLSSVSTGNAQVPYLLQTIDVPSDPPFSAPANHTFVTGISGQKLVGIYSDKFGITNGFYYNGTNWIQLNFTPTGISGSTIVGEEFTTNGVKEGVIYRNGVVSVFKVSLVGGGTVGNVLLGDTELNGISGTHIVGTYTDTNKKYQAFLYNGTNASKLVDPSTLFPNGTNSILVGTTVPTSIDKTHVVGFTHSVLGTSGIHGFLYDGKNWTMLDCPFGGHTMPSGISGSNIVGTYTDVNGTTRGFLYNTNTTNWTSIDDLLGDQSIVSTGTYPTGVDGNTIVGTYTDTNSLVQSFQLTQEVLSQSITIDTNSLDSNSLPPSISYGSKPRVINATADSGLPVTFASSNPKVATISHTNMITFAGVGSTIITATQAGGNGTGGIYLAATPVKLKLTVFKGTQSIINFAPTTPQSFAKNFQVIFRASSTSGLPVTFTSNKASIISIAGKVGTIKAKGGVTITANQKGDANWASAVPVPVTITVQ